MKSKVLLSFMSCLIVLSMFSTAAFASNNTESHDVNMTVANEIKNMVNNQIQYTEYSTIESYEEELKNFVNNTVLTKPLEEYSQEELDEWNKLFNTLQLVSAPVSAPVPVPVSSQRSATLYSIPIYKDVQKDIEATLITARYGAVVASGVLYSTEQANREQITYQNQHGFTTTHENEVDAFRHFSWNYHMTDNILISRNAATLIADNHEFSAHGARYAMNNWPNATQSYQVAQGIYYTNKVKEEVENSSSILTFKKYFINSNFMDFNNNEAGRAYESKGYSNNFDAFAAAKAAGHVTTSPSEWDSTFLANKSFAIFKKEFSY